MLGHEHKLKMVVFNLIFKTAAEYSFTKLIYYPSQTK